MCVVERCARGLEPASEGPGATFPGIAGGGGRGVRVPPFSLAEQPRCRAGFDFLRLRSQVNEIDEELAHWWETFSTASDAVRRDMVDEIRLAQQRAKPRGAAKGDGKGDGKAGRGGSGRVFRAPADAQNDASVDDVDLTSPAPDELLRSDEAAPAKKRRRRRRKPNGAGDAGGMPDAGGSSE